MIEKMVIWYLRRLSEDQLIKLVRLVTGRKGVLKKKKEAIHGRPESV